MKEIKDIKNNDRTYKPAIFYKICNTFLDYMASNGRPVAAGDCLLNFMHSEKKKSKKVTPQAFLTHFQKR